MGIEFLLLISLKEKENKEPAQIQFQKTKLGAEKCQDLCNEKIFQKIFNAIFSPEKINVRYAFGVVESVT